ncbi:MAG: Mut7-C RNAse domain-containing protein [Gammaproteobacteria bacterium]
MSLRPIWQCEGCQRIYWQGSQL